MAQIAPRRNKYGAQRCTYDGYSFDSLKERDHYLALKISQQLGEISGLAVHPAWVLSVCEIEIGRYEADFSYVLADTGAFTVEDVKSVATKTPLWRWKVKHLAAEHGITVQVVE